MTEFAETDRLGSIDEAVLFERPARPCRHHNTTEIHPADQFHCHISTLRDSQRPTGDGNGD
jgi:hypothetical protein